MDRLLPALALPLAALAAALAYAGIKCQDLQPGGCKCIVCCTYGTCPSGDWSGWVCRCGEGDPALAPAKNKCGGERRCFDGPDSAHDALTKMGYCNSWYGAGYSQYDYTKALGNGKCRYQAIVDDAKRCVELRDGPEPNPQPAYFCNGNPDLWLPWGYVVDTIKAWHDAC